MVDDAKAHLTRYLRQTRSALLWKLDGLSERDLRLPRTPTGTNLLGLVKHSLHTEAGYFGATFGRVWPTPSELVPEDATNPQADWFATARETADSVIDLYRRVQEFADTTIAELPLTAEGTVPHWPADRARVTLHQILVHVITDLSRHAGHADILREQIDGSVGLSRRNTNIPGSFDWSAYVAELTELAERTPDAP